MLDDILTIRDIIEFCSTDDNLRQQGFLEGKIKEDMVIKWFYHDWVNNKTINNIPYTHTGSMLKGMMIHSGLITDLVIAIRSIPLNQVYRHAEKIAVATNLIYTSFERKSIRQIVINENNLYDSLKEQVKGSYGIMSDYLLYFISLYNKILLSKEIEHDDRCNNLIALHRKISVEE